MYIELCLMYITAVWNKYIVSYQLIMTVCKFSDKRDSSSSKSSVSQQLIPQ